MSKSKLLVACLTVCLTLSAGAVRADELAIQTSSRSGGDIRVLTFRAGQHGYFSITGRVADTAVVNAGGMRLSISIEKLITRNTTPVVVESWTRLPDGRTRVFLRVNSVSMTFNNGTVSLHAGGERGPAIDTDRISVTR